MEIAEGPAKARNRKGVSGTAAEQSPATRMVSPHLCWAPHGTAERGLHAHTADTPSWTGPPVSVTGWALFLRMARKRKERLCQGLHGTGVGVTGTCLSAVPRSRSRVKDLSASSLLGGDPSMH